MKKSRRTAQVGDVVRNELAAIIRKELSDPELKLLSINDVEMTPDLRIARVFVSTFGQGAEQERAVLALQKARTRLRHLLAQQAMLRFTPELEFRSDLTARNASSIEALLQQVLPKGEALAEGIEKDTSEEEE